MSQTLGSCRWNGNEIVNEKNEAVAGIAPDAPESWGYIFAAAPDLLATLDAILNEVMADPQSPPYSADSYLPLHLVEQAQAAINKARGGV